MRPGRFGRLLAGALPLSKTITMTLALFGASSTATNADPVDDAWLAAVQQNTAASYSQFVLDYPDSEYAFEAECRIGMFDFNTTGSAAPEGQSGASQDGDFCVNLPAAQTLLNI